MDLCGEPVPLHIQEVAERFDKEFTLVVYNHAQVYLWLKRMERYFPWIEERLRHYKLPDDLKYVAIVESDLLPNACSPKGAAGPWQFMPKTGCSYGLDTQGSYDERFDFELATDCAFRYLQDLHKRYKNWALAIACYNCGDKRILDEMKAQRTNEYYHLKLPLETERYVFRILAIKAVLNNPSQYGYHLPKGQGYPELRADKATITLSRSTPVQAIASAAGTTFREIKRLNPTFRADDIPAGTYEIKLPKGSGRDFQQNFDGAGSRPTADAYKEIEKRVSSPEPVAEPLRTSTTAAETKPAKSSEKKAEPAKHKTETASSAYYTVKKGDTLSSIAQRNKVSVEEVRKLNKLKGNGITPGQKIRIR
jgi:LysM repeat protein